MYLLVEWVAIAERADELGVVRGARFSDCTIMGPAALALVADGNRLIDCDFMRPAGAADGARAPVTLQLVDCCFERCRFDSSISFRGRDGDHATRL